MAAADPAPWMRAADAVEKVPAGRPELIRPRKGRLLAEIAAIPRQEVRWHVAQILPRLDLSAPERAEAVDRLLGFLENPSRIVQVNAMQALATRPPSEIPGTPASWPRSSGCPRRAARPSASGVDGSCRGPGCTTRPRRSPTATEPGDRRAEGSRAGRRVRHRRRGFAGVVARGGAGRPGAIPRTPKSSSSRPGAPDSSASSAWRNGGRTLAGDRRRGGRDGAGGGGGRPWGEGGAAELGQDDEEERHQRRVGEGAGEREAGEDDRAADGGLAED